MDQTIAQSHLDSWLAADSEVSIGKSYTIGNRQLTRADATEVRNQVTYWQRIVAGFQSAGAGGTNPGFRIGVFK